MGSVVPLLSRGSIPEENPKTLTDSGSRGKTVVKGK